MKQVFETQDELMEQKKAFLQQKNLAKEEEEKLMASMDEKSRAEF